MQRASQHWNIDEPILPTRSRLYNLEPIGVGTAKVECLTSYISRLAEQHCLSTFAMLCEDELVLWSFENISTCPWHQELLCQMCQHCSSRLPYLAAYLRPGHCSTCRGWLGKSDANKQGQFDGEDLLSRNSGVVSYTVKSIGE